MKKIDLNCDMGESLPGDAANIDHEIMPYISSCNIACGFHSGSPRIIENTLRNAIDHNLKIGAHPSYDDRENFGRISIEIPLPELLSQLRYQICALQGMAESLGGRLNHVKPHGALYNDMVKNEELAEAFVVLVKEIDPKLQIYGLAGSQLSTICVDHKMVFVNEGFADRKYDTKTQLRNRKYDGAVLSEENEILQQIELLSNGVVELYSGEKVDMSVDTICLHGDTPGAIRLSKVIYDFIRSKSISIG
ncbi:5-oxoprolinase subunit PxpA [Portibacter lacus]|uniref:UPF0271 protein n=1 Tax=Portibacter lacus TaxID=1099794 RepID=A0AA37SQW3_9BACT|nr:5-oxoprolinase subunit PxpA [Portibacter lacus]GLR18024.1 UPF0271 protein [Portibacter lacus]